MGFLWGREMPLFDFSRGAPACGNRGANSGDLSADRARARKLPRYGPPPQLNRVPVDISVFVVTGEHHDHRVFARPARARFTDGPGSDVLPRANGPFTRRAVTHSRCSFSHTTFSRGTARAADGVASRCERSTGVTRTCTRSGATQHTWANHRGNGPMDLKNCR